MSPLQVKGLMGVVVGVIDAGFVFLFFRRELITTRGIDRKTAVRVV